MISDGETELVQTCVMKTKNKLIAAIKKITFHKKLLNELHAARQAMPGYTTVSAF